MKKLILAIGGSAALGLAAFAAVAPGHAQTSAAPEATIKPILVAAAGADAAQGKTLYTNTCSACHQITGLGLKGAFPPLKGNAVANAPDATEHIHIVLFGTHGKVIDGVKYAAPMPAWGSQFTDQQIAAIINYERSAWGNHGTPVTAAQVAKVRAQGK